MKKHRNNLPHLRGNMFRLTMTAALFSCAVGRVYSAQEDEWKFTVSFPMIWVTNIRGEIDVDDNRLDVDTSFQDTLDSLEFGYMAEFYASKGPWRYALKLNYSESKDEFITEDYTVPPGLPIAPSHKIKIEKEEGTSDLIVGYQLENRLVLYTGVRAIFSEIDLTIKPRGSGIIEIDTRVNVADENLYDWLIGAEYQYDINPNWSLAVNADYGIAGDNDKDYLANATVTYRISKLNSVWAGYRYFRVADKSVEDGVHVESDFVTQGPTIGWAFTF